MSLATHPLAGQRIADIVRLDTGTAAVFADAGIGPRFLFHTVASAAREQGVDLNTIVAGLLNRFRQAVPPATS
jgi:hypothetical protein